MKRKAAIMLLAMALLAESLQMTALARTTIFLLPKCSICREYTRAKIAWERQYTTPDGWVSITSPKGTVGRSHNDWNYVEVCDESKHLRTQLFRNQLGNGS